MELTLILTEACNLRCTYCYQPAYPESAMPVATGVAALRSAVAAGPGRIALTFFGGEPLLRADAMLAILREARAIERASGVPVTAKVSTNGLLLDDGLVAQARELGLFISLSHDGTPDAQDAGRPRPGGGASSAAADAALARLAASGQPFAVYSVVTPANVRSLATSRRRLWDAGARILITAVDYTARWDGPALRALRDSVREVGEFYRGLLLDRCDGHLEPFDSRIALRTRPEAGCCPGVSQLTVAPDGTLYGCVEYFHRRLLPLGTATGWIDRAQVAKLARARAPQPEECSDCGVADRCNHQCACVNLRTTGSVDRPPEALCLSEQAVLAEVDDWAAERFRERAPEFLLRQYSASYHLLSSIERWLGSLDVAGSPR